MQHLPKYQPIVIKTQPLEEYQFILNKFNNLEKKIEELQAFKPKRKHRTKEDIEKHKCEYNPYKKDGKLKARPADPIKSYDEFNAIQNYFLDNGEIRNWALWVVGISLGVRISDLIKLKISFVLNKDLTFKDYLRIYEKKTGKPNKCLITESIKYALSKYFDSISWKFNFDDYIFKSQKKGMLLPQSGWRIISNAAKALAMKSVISSHTMRKSFVCIAICLGKTTIDPYKMEIMRLLCNHDDIRTTAAYVSVVDEIKDEHRVAVSDFVLGKSNVNELSLVKKLVEEKDNEIG